MKNPSGFVLGLLVLIMAIVISFIPHPKIGFFGFLLYIGTTIGYPASLCLMLGGIFNSKNLSGVGFGIGLPSWRLMIIGSLFGIFQCQNMAATSMMEGLAWLIFSAGDPFIILVFVFGIV